MGKRTLKETIAAMPDPPRGTPSHSASSRRESEARSIERKHGSVLGALARIAFEDPDTATRLAALRALAPYLYPQLKAIEVSGPAGERLVVEVRKA